MLNYVDSLSSTLQHKSMSAAGGQVIAKMTVETLKFIHDDKSSDLFWECTKKKAEIWEVDKPRLPQQCKLPSRYDDGLSDGDFHASFYKQKYFEVLDLMNNCIEQRVDHPGYRIFSQWSHYSSKLVCKMILNLSSKMCMKLTKMTWIKTFYSPNLSHLE